MTSLAGKETAAIHYPPHLSTRNVIEGEPNPPCPCCDPYPGALGNLTTLNEPQNASESDDKGRSSSLPNNEDDDDDYEFENDLLPGTLRSGVYYEPTELLAEGWVHIKGTGKGWLGSRSWKARYVKLVVSLQLIIRCLFSRLCIE